MNHLSIRNVNGKTVSLTSVFKTKKGWQKSTVNSTQLGAHDIEHLIAGVGFTEEEEEITIAVSYSYINDLNHFCKILDPSGRFSERELRVKIDWYKSNYIHLNFSEFEELLKKSATPSCKVIIINNKVRVLYC
jgi:hypothetical protein